MRVRVGSTSVAPLADVMDATRGRLASNAFCISGRRGGNSLTTTAGQPGECERLAAAGHQGAHSALFAANPVLFTRA